MKFGEPLQLTAEEGVKVLKFLSMTPNQMDTYIDNGDYCGDDLFVIWKHMKILDAFIRDGEDGAPPRYAMVPAAYMKAVEKVESAVREAQKMSFQYGTIANIESALAELEAAKGDSK